MSVHFCTCGHWLEGHQDHCRSWECGCPAFEWAKEIPDDLSELVSDLGLPADYGIEAPK